MTTAKAKMTAPIVRLEKRGDEWAVIMRSGKVEFSDIDYAKAVGVFDYINSRRKADVAQGIEQGVSTAKVAGSNPAVRAIELGHYECPLCGKFTTSLVSMRAHLFSSRHQDGLEVLSALRENIEMDDEFEYGVTGK